MKGSTTFTTTQRKPSTTPTTSSSIAAYSTTRLKQNEVYEDYSEVRLYYIERFFFLFKIVFNKEQRSSLITNLFLFHLFVILVQ
jgi:hypothetical protein